MGHDVEGDLVRLVAEMTRLNEATDGRVMVTFGRLFKDDRCCNLFEALAGTLKTAKKRGVVTYQGELLLQGMSDKVEVVLVQQGKGPLV